MKDATTMQEPSLKLCFNVFVLSFVLMRLCLCPCSALSHSSYDDYNTESDIIFESNSETENYSENALVGNDPFLEDDIIPSASNVHPKYIGLRWPNATVPFLFHNTLGYYGRYQVLRAMDEYHRHTCIQFKRWQSERDFLVIGSYRIACASSVGRQGGPQLMHLGPACTRVVGTPMHELMHALGFFHEHMRPDRDKYVFINYSNINEALWKNFRIMDHIQHDDMGAGYDFGSLMHYRLCAMSNNSWPTIVPKIQTNVKNIGQRKGFSKKDIIKINHWYNCSTYYSRLPKKFSVEAAGKKTFHSNSALRITRLKTNNWLIYITGCFLFSMSKYPIKLGNISDLTIYSN